MKRVGLNVSAILGHPAYSAQRQDDQVPPSKALPGLQKPFNEIMSRTISSGNDHRRCFIFFQSFKNLNPNTARVLWRCSRVNLVRDFQRLE